MKSIRICRHKSTGVLCVGEFRDGKWLFSDVASLDEAKAMAKRLRVNRARRERHKALTDLGLKRVRGALGGVYYE